MLLFYQQTKRFEGQLPHLHSAATPNNSSHLKTSDYHGDSTCLLALRDNKGDKFPLFLVADRATLLL